MSATRNLTSILVLSLGLVLGLVDSAQASWTVTGAFEFGDFTDDLGDATAVDAAGNVYLAGSFQNTINLGGLTYTSAGGLDVYVAKFDPTGTHLWSTAGGGSDDEYVEDMVVDSLGNVIVVGSMASVDATFGGGTLVSAGSNDAFIVKYNVFGLHSWSKNYGDTLADRATSVDVDDNRNILLGGTFLNTVDFGRGPLTSNGSSDIFVVILDPAGNEFGSIHYGGTSTESDCQVAFDSVGNLVVAGSFRDVADFGTGPLTSAGEYDIFLAKYQAGTATPLWSQRSGGPEFDSPSDIATGALGSIFVTGFFNDVVNFGGGGLASEGAADAFVAAYAAGGAHVWSRAMGSRDEDAALGIDVVGDRVVVAGYFSDDADFGPFALTSAGYIDTFVMEFGFFGVEKQVLGGGGLGLDLAYDVAIGDDGVFLAGTFDGPSTFDPRTLNGLGGLDAFLLRYGSDATGIEIVGTPAATGLQMAPARPNPFRSTTTLAYDRSRSGHANFEIFDVAGRLVYRESLMLEAGSGTLSWNGKDLRGNRAAIGMYFARLSDGVESVEQRVTLMR